MQPPRPPITTPSGKAGFFLSRLLCVPASEDVMAHNDSVRLPGIDQAPGVGQGRGFRAVGPVSRAGLLPRTPCLAHCPTPALPLLPKPQEGPA